MKKAPLTFTMVMVALHLAAAPALYMQDAYAADTDASQSLRNQRGATPSEIEQERRQAEEQAPQSLDPDAVSAIEETQKAVDFLAQGQTAEALSAIERATGKTDTLMARKPAEGLLPVANEVMLVDIAPMDAKAIRRIGKLAEKAVDDKNYPAARELLAMLQSDITVRTTHLPLATYPAALAEAARLIDQNKPEEARIMLLTALHTLVLVDRVLPVPAINAQIALAAAEDQRDKDRDKALRFLALSRSELERTRELGYTAGNDAAYADWKKDINTLEKQIKGKENSGSTFSTLKEKLKNFFKRHFGPGKQAMSPQK